MVEAEDAEIHKFFPELEEKSECVMKYKIGTEDGDDKEGTVLNRAITVTSEGLLWVVDIRHAELIVAELGLCTGSSAQAEEVR